MSLGVLSFLTPIEIAAQPDPLEEAEAQKKISNCKTADEKYELGLEFRNGKIPGFQENDDLTLRKAIACFLEKAKKGDEKANHNIGMALWKLHLEDAAYPFFSEAAKKGLVPSQNNKTEMKKDGFIRRNKGANSLEIFKDTIPANEAAPLLKLIRKYEFLPSSKKLERLENLSLNNSKLMTEGQEFFSKNFPNTPGLNKEMFAATIAAHSREVGFSVYSIVDCLEPFRHRLPSGNATVLKHLTKLEATLSNYIFNFHYSAAALLSEEPGVSSLGNSKEKELENNYKIIKHISNTAFNILKHYNRIGNQDNQGIIKQGRHDDLGYVKVFGDFIPFSFPRKIDSLRLHAFPFKMTGLGQSGVLLEPQKIIRTPGIILLKPESHGLGSLKASVKLYTGEETYLARPYELSFYTSYLDLIDSSKNDDFGKLIYSSFDPDELKQFAAKKREVLFLPLSPSKEDTELFELLVLEDLIMAQKDKGHPNHLKAIEYITELEKKESSSIDQIVEKYTQRILSAYEEAIQKEQESISKAVAEEKISGRANKSRKKKGYKAPAVTKTSASLTSSSNISKKAAERLESYKQEGRIKYKKVLSLVNVIMKKYPASAYLNVSISGSHVTYHGIGEKSAGSLIVHGSGDKTLPAGQFNYFATGLLKLIIKQEEANQKIQALPQFEK